MSEFGARGLELDATLLAWGTDFRRDGCVAFVRPLRLVDETFEHLRACGWKPI